MGGVRAGSRRCAVVRVVAVLLAAGLTGCAGIPTSGPVREGGDVPDVEQPVPLSVPVDPVVDGTPEEIVRGFLQAGAAGLSDEFRVARTFLTGGASWDPRAQVLISTSQGREVREEGGGGTVTVTVTVEAVVDEAGVYTEVAARAPQSLEFELVQDSADQWRITSAPSGVVMTPRDFAQLYRDVPVYFASPDLTHLVPDLRHFPAGDDLPTLAVSALLGGPSPWLRGAVLSAVPEGSRLSVSAVPLAGTVATVDLTASANLDNVNRDLLQVQLEATLRRLPPPAITEVSVTVGGVPLGDPGTTDELAIDPEPAAGPFVLVGDQLAEVDQGAIVPLDAAPLDGLVADSPALSLDGEIRVVRSGLSRLMLLPLEGAEPVELLNDSMLIAPSVDRFGWVWSGPEASNGSLIAVTELGERTDVAADWLEGSLVRSLRVSRDGTRVAVVSQDENGRVRVDVAGVVRDDGRPLRLSESWQIGAPLTTATEVSWVDEVTVAVLGTTGSAGSPAMHLVPLGGRTSALSIVENATGIATGRGSRAQYVVDAGGQLWLRQGTAWLVVATGVSDAVFPG
jgi:hypothetical protein